MSIGPVSQPVNQPQQNNNSADQADNSQDQANLQQAMFSARKSQSAYMEQTENGQTSGVKLDLSKNVSMGVNKKTAQMVIETKVKMSVSAHFEGNPEAGGPAAGEGNGGFTPEKTAERLVDFAKKFMGDFLESSGEGEEAAEQSEGQAEGKNKGLEAFKEEVKAASEEGFENARKELGEALTGEIDGLFNEVKSQFEEMLSMLGEEGDTEATEEAAGTEDANGPEAVNSQAAEAIAGENSRAADMAGNIPAAASQLFGQNQVA